MRRLRGAPRHLRVRGGLLLPCPLVIGHPRRTLTPPPAQPPRGRSRRATGARRAGLVGPGFALLALLLTACADAPQNGLSPAGIYARRADNLFSKVFIIAVLAFALRARAVVSFL